MSINILIIGNFGVRNNKLDGQTIKTRNIYQLLADSVSNVEFYNTEFKTIKSISNLIKNCFKANKIIIVPAQNSLVFLFPFVYLISFLRRTPLYYIVIGGWLIELMNKKYLLKSMLKNIRCIFSETRLMQEGLESMGFKNVVYLPNFRDFHKLEEACGLEKEPFSKELRLVFMSRIQSLKGVDVLIDSLYDLLNTSKTNKVSLDFYGQIDENYRDIFFDKLRKSKNIKYCGSLNPEEIQSTLSNYDILVLPTRYYTEGLPGAIIDAYSAGIPVLVTKWKHAEEFVKHGKTGVIISFDNPKDELINSIETLLKNDMLLPKLKVLAREESYYYSQDYVRNILLEQLKEN